MHKKVNYVVRSVGNRSSRGRFRADLSQQTTRFSRGLVIMTAENPLAGQSIVGPWFMSGRSWAISLYLQYLSKHWQRIAQIFPDMVDAASNKARQAGGSAIRPPDGCHGCL